MELLFPATTLAAITLTLISCDKHEAHDHSQGHSQEIQKKQNHSTGVPHDHDGDGISDHGPGEHHESVKKVAGPNGGLIFFGPNFRAEFFVTDDQKIQFTFLDDTNKAIPAAAQIGSILCGDTSNPTTLALTKKDDGSALISTATLPTGNHLPTVITIQTDPDAAPLRAQFNLNLTQCASCPHKEYARTYHALTFHSSVISEGMASRKREGRVM